jgi:1,5-anhydro-D-fructose reductase (1,5-anhydro-D-mannitol-forming)
MERSTTPIRWGLLGASTIAREWMIPALRALDGHEIVAVCSSSAERGAAFAREQQIPVAYDDLAAFLAAPDVDAVYVSTTNELHERQTIAAARAGKHVLCEKPLALELGAARRMVDACQDAGVVLAVNHHFRNGAWNRAARAAIRNGAIGRPLSARISQALLLPEHLRGWRLGEPGRGAGAILDLTVHTADTLRFVLDAEVEQVVAASACQSLGRDGVEDVAMGVMRLSNGVLASFYDAFNVPYAGSSLEVHGSEGSIAIAEALDERLIARAVLRRADGEQPLDVGEQEDLYVYGLRRFAAAVAGQGTPAAGGEDGLRSLAVALAVRAAASGGHQATVEVQE